MSEWTKELGERIRYLRKRLAGMTQRELAAQLGLDSPDSITRLENGTSNRANLGVLRGLIELAREHLHDANWLMEGEEPSSETAYPTFADLGEASHDELMKEFARLTVQSQVVSDLIKTAGDPDARKALVESMTPPPEADRPARRKPRRPAARRGYRTVAPEDVPSAQDWHKHYVPIVGRIAAGQGLDTDTVEATEYPPGWAAEFVVYDDAPDTSVAVRIKGDSMGPDFRDGDMVVVDPAGEADFGEICCVMVRAGDTVEARLKRPRLDGGRVVLESLNPDPRYAPEPVGVDAVVGRFPIVAHLPLIVRE